MLKEATLLDAPAPHRRNDLSAFAGSEILLALSSSSSEIEQLDQARNPDPLELYNSFRAWVHRVALQVMKAEKAGTPRELIVEALSGARAVIGNAPWVRRLQTWPRGYPGDFETIAQLLEGVDGSPTDTIAKCADMFALNSAIAQQHRNKIAMQTDAIAEALATHQDILLIACGSAIDAATAVARVPGTESTLVLNDIDADALAASARLLIPLGVRFETRQGNIVKQIHAMGKDRFRLILAGGLFDYLNGPAATFLVDGAMEALAEGGSMIITNIARGNPYRPIIEYLAEWHLIERDENELAALLHAAGVAASQIAFTRDPSGLTIMARITKGR